MSFPDYILVTAARDEEKHIERTLDSVVSQTVLPRQWIIVSDRSLDRTDEIVLRYASQHSYIQLVRRVTGTKRDFSSKVEALRLGLSQTGQITHSFIGMLDADLSFEKNYFAEVLRMFSITPGLGLAGGIYYEFTNGGWFPVRTALDWSVSGGVQMFRRECYESFGGYIPLPYGGIDTVAEVMTRKAGWLVRTNPNLVVKHHRRMGTAAGGALQAGFMEGWRDFTVGYHPLFELAKRLSRIGQRPYFIRSICGIAGFCAARIVARQPLAPDSLVRFLQREQRGRMASFLAGRAPRRNWG
jgi:poly-beta-1,6-N-acetyl-D-glucosamine synthase